MTAYRIKPFLTIFFLTLLIMSPLILPLGSAQPDRSLVKEISLPKDFHDQGVLSDLDSKVRWSLPSWLPQDQLSLYQWSPHEEQITYLTLFYRSTLLALFPLAGGQLSSHDLEYLTKTYPKLVFPSIYPSLPRRLLKGHDRDHDHILDALDIHIGSIKTELNGAQYQEGYERLSYPGGDVSREIGVCTDVIVRAFRNAGWDLQKLVYQDMLSAPKAYRISKRPNRHIDHRRVRRLIVYFKRHYQSLPIQFDPANQKGEDAWLPGDLIFMDTMSKGRPTHVALVSDRLAESGIPLVINNWTYGYQTSEMDLKEAATWLYRFRITQKRR